jgi:hypothetical protein
MIRRLKGNTGRYVGRGSVSLGERQGGPIHGISFHRNFVIYNTGLKQKILSIYGDINNDNYRLY